MSRKEKQPQCKCPQTTARQIRTIPRKTRDHENSRRENHWKKLSNDYVPSTKISGASENTGCGQPHWKGDITVVIKSHQTTLYSQILPRNEPKAHLSLHKH
ncbi:uncharacterized protein [Montipora foliosa]|uniref:uncharacterized protein n=1 Tax=Montipora foliosa TaxID=591990 RepID=UPI0035F1EA7F